MRHIVIGLNIAEAQGYAIESLRDEKQVSIMSAYHAVTGGLNGIGPDTTIHPLPRCAMAAEGVSLSQKLRVLAARGVHIKTGAQ